MVGVKDGVGEKTSLAYSACVSALSVLMVGVGEPPPVFGIWSRGSGMPSLVPAVIKYGMPTPIRHANKSAPRIMRP